MTLSRDRLEHDLRAAARDFDDVAASPAAWQDNQSRLAGRRARRTRTLLGAAAAVAVLAVAGAMVVRSESPSRVPASGSDDPFSLDYILGEPVVLEALTLGGESVVHEAVLSDMTGDGPRLCDRFVGDQTDAPVCTDRAQGADEPEVAIDWVTEVRARDDRLPGTARGVVGGVDRRVSFVDVWMNDGTRVRAQLEDGGWEGTRLFGLTGEVEVAVPQRLVAYGRDGNVMQSVDLVARFGHGWLPERRLCDGEESGSFPIEGADGPRDVAVSFGATDALVTGSAGGTPVCLDRIAATAIAGHTFFGPLVVAVLAPETELVRVQSGSRTVAEIKPFTAAGTPWRVVVLRGLSSADLSRAELVAYDLHGLELDRAYVAQPQSH